MELLREWLGDAKSGLRGIVEGVTQDPEHLLLFVWYTILISIFVLGATSALFGWPYDFSGSCGYGDPPDVDCP